jgi:hypothetical protein
MRKVINALLIVDIGIIIFTLLSGNRDWFINSQIGFFSSSLVMFASIISYRNMVKSRLEAGAVIEDDNRDTIDKIDDPHDLYTQDEKSKDIALKDIVKEERENLKNSRRSIWQVTKDSKASLSFYRLGAYGALILGFFYLNNNHILDISSYLFSLVAPPIIIIIILMREK